MDSIDVVASTSAFRKFAAEMDSLSASSASQAPAQLSPMGAKLGPAAEGALSSASRHFLEHVKAGAAAEGAARSGPDVAAAGAPGGGGDLSLLSAYVAARGPPAVDAAAEEESTTRIFSETLLRRRRRDAEARSAAPHPSLRRIPVFHRRRARARSASAHEEKLASCEEGLVALARSIQLSSRAESLIPLDQQERLEDELAGGSAGEPKMLSYEEYRALRRQLPAPSHAMLSARAFLSLPRDEEGRVSAAELFRRIYNTTCVVRTRVALQQYDHLGRGYLREQDLENYIYDHIPTVPLLRPILESFLPYYVYTAVRRFMFFLDPKRVGRVSIKKLAASAVMEELFELGAADPDAAPGGTEQESHSDNWFSLENAYRVYNSYLELDSDQNGMLSKQEFAAFGSRPVGAAPGLQLAGGAGPGGRLPVRLSRSFVDAVFDETPTYRTGGESGGEPEMDYRSFLDFVLAMENRRAPQSIALFHRALDVRKCGHIGSFEIAYFYRDLAAMLEDAGVMPPELQLEDVQAEIFDMVSPREPGKITLEDLLRSGVGHTVVSLLSDCNGFLAYENRESIGASSEDDEELGPEGSRR